MDAVIAFLLSLGMACSPVQVHATAYAPLDNQSGICADSTPTKTSRGYYPQKQIIAVDPREIPYGTLVYIPKYGYAIAGDTGSALRNNKDHIAIDLFMDTYKEAIQWGRRDIIIYVYRHE